ncbi:MAG: hypothetical protein K6G42_06435 [Lachnospiraceae bacterium]|nr:hypothetical protein [Lachnospiraceae bacterium]
MPKSKKPVIAPKKMNFNSGFLSNDNIGQIDAGSIDPSKISFMDSGQSAFTGEGAVDPDTAALLEGSSRADVAAGVQHTLLERMKQENDISDRETALMSEKHNRYTQDVIRPMINLSKAKFRQSKIELAEAYLAQSLLSQESASQALQRINSMIAGEQESRDAVEQTLQAEAARLAQELAAGAPPGGQAQQPAPGVAPVGQPLQNPMEAGPQQVPGEVSEGAAVMPGIREGGAAAGEEGLNPGLPPEAGMNPNAEQQILNPAAGLAGPQEQANPAVAAEVRQDQVGVNGEQYNAGPLSVESVQNELAARNADLTRLMAIRNSIDTNQLAANRPGRFKKFFSGAEKTARTAMTKYSNTRNEAINLKAKILAKSSEWSRFRENYRESSFRKHYKEFDRLATSYFAYSRTRDDRTLPDGYKKNISEYTGVYDSSQISFIVNDITADPFSDTPPLRHVRSKAVAANSSLNYDAPDRPVKFHRGIVMSAFSGDNRTLGDQQESNQPMVRMKLNSSFTGYKARRQITIQNGVRRMLDRFEGGANTDHVPGQEQSADDMNLRVNERGANNEFLFSEESARIYQARTSTIGGSRVNGFYLNGEFISADYDRVKTMSETGGLRNPNWNKVADEERLRTAIRRSDFFRHVNAKSIQYYMSYNPSDEFKMSAKRDKFIQQGGGAEDADIMVSTFFTNATQQLRENGASFDDILNSQNPANPDETFRTIYDNILKNESAARNLGMLFLSEENPAVWEFGTRVATDLGGRFKRVLSYTTNGGQAMRMELLTEFSKDRGIDWTNITGSLLTPNAVQQYKEDLAARRDGFFSFTNLKQSFFDGTILGVMSGLLVAGTGDLVHMDMKNAPGFSDVFNSFNTNYGKLIAESSTNLGVFLSPVPGVLKGLGKDEAATDSILGALSVTTFLKVVQDIAKLVKTWKKSKEEGHTWSSSLKIGSLIVTTVKDLISIIKFWLSKVSFLAKANDVTSAIINLIDILANITTIITSSMTLNSISKSDSNITTALEQFREQRNGQHGPANEAAMETDTQKMGAAAYNNAQGQYLLALAKSNASRSRKMAISGMVTSGLGVAAGTIGAFNPIKIPFLFLSQVSKFVGWCIGKVHDSSHFNENVGMQLGDKSLTDVSNFSDVLKRETGIKNKHYLVDLARIFMSIDTHYMATKPIRTPGETALSMNVLSPILELSGENEDRYHRQSNINKLANVKLDKVMNLVGAPGNWRAVLRNALA